MMPGMMDDQLSRVLSRLRDRQAGWRESVYGVVSCIPRGHVLGYKDVAVLLGRPNNARQVGYALAAILPSDQVPWWRVIRSNGSIALQGDPDRGPQQQGRLAAEGITISQAYRVDMRVYRWDPWR